MSLFLLEFSSNAFASRKTPVPFDNGQGFPYFLPVFPKGNSFQILTFSTEVLEGKWNSGSYCGPCNLRSLMWSLSNLKDPGGNIFTMLVIILHNIWILNTVMFQCKWWLFLFMSLIWFCSCNTATRFCEGGIIFGFCTNISQCGVILENEGREFWEIGGNWSRRPNLLPLFRWINGTSFLDSSPILCIPVPVSSYVLWRAEVFSLIWSWLAVAVQWLGAS